MQVVARANEWEDVDNVTERIKLLAMLTVLKSWYPKLFLRGLIVTVLAMTSNKELKIGDNKFDLRVHVFFLLIYS